MPTDHVSDPRDAPRPMAGSGRLPAQVSSFVGRTQELIDLDSMLDTSRLITLTGPGGSGKTRLAVELAAIVRDRQGGSFEFVDLAPVTELDHAPGALAGALDIREVPDEPLLDTVIKRIADRPLRLILDNLEQLPEIGGVVGDLLSRCPNLRLLATSRGPLHVRGEREYPVGPLPVPSSEDGQSLARVLANPSVALFVDRASAIRPGFAVTSESAPAVAEICRRLDGLPLAIELAAARSRLFGPEALLARLEPRLELLTHGAADAPSRQQTLRATIAWSVDLLEKEEQDTFASLAVFVGGFTAADATAVAPDIVDPMATLERLVDRSLLRVDPDLGVEPRFGMLETIREYAWDQLSEARRMELRQRHLAHFVALVEDLRRESRGAGQGIVIRRLLAEQANIRASLVQARDRDPAALVRLVAALPRRFWYGAGLREGLVWFEEAHSVIEEAPTPAAIRARLFEQGASMLVELGDTDQAAAILEESLGAAEQAKDDLGQFEAWLGLAYIALTSRDLDVAHERMNRAMSFARRTAHDGRIAEAQVGLALVSRLRGDVGFATTMLDDAIKLATSSDDPWVAAAALYHRGDLERTSGEAGHARETLLEARDRARAAGDAELEDWATISLVRVAIVPGQLADARSMLLAAAARIRALDHPLDGLFLLDAASDWFEAVGLPGESVEAFGAADRARTDLKWGDPPDERNGRRRVLERGQRVLGPVRFATRWATGHGRGLGEALDAVIAAVESADPEQIQVIAGRSAGRPLGLTVREQEIAALVAAGMSDGEVADALVISKKTVSVHVANVKGKLGARNRVEIATKAAALGLTAKNTSE